jgi:hypothetical protein
MKRNIIFFLFLISSVTIAQELNCKVIVNYESLPVVNRELLTDFAPVIEDYMNRTRFTNEEWQGPKIPCTINIFFTSASSEVNYTAQVVVVSQRPIYNTGNFSPILTVNDNTWSFKYERGQSLYTQSTFDPITSFLDYYANIIIGLDWDTYEPLGGTPFFSRAFDIVNLGNTSAFAAGWQQTSSTTYSRWSLVADLLNDRYRGFREAFYNYHYNGVDIFHDDRELALENIAGLVNTLEQMRTKVDLNSVLIRTFFDSKNGELADYLVNFQDPEIFQTLKRIDPRHASRYDEALSRIR